MQKAYVRQNFVNGTDPALDEVDMNKIDSGLSEVDDRVILLEGAKADKTSVLACVNSIIYTISTGILRITYVSGAVQDVNLGLNNVALSMSPLGVITMQDSEGNTYTCDLREIINSDLAELGDVNITDPEDGQVLKYNAETGKWENGEGGLGTAVSYEAQTLTDSQKAQARSNIDAASVDELSHENLLDNPFFTVNERGQSSYSGKTYTVDRWYSYDSSSHPLSNTITLGDVVINGVSWIRQPFDVHVPSGKYTISMYLDGELKKVTFDYTNDGQPHVVIEQVATNVRIVMSFFDSNTAGRDALFLFFDGYNESHTVKAAKFEVGSVSTLANDVPRPYAEELARCQTSTADVNDTYANKGNLVTSNSIAPTEDGATASKAYDVGETFFRDGDYCICISDIVSGGSFTLNTNYIKVPLGGTPSKYVMKFRIGTLLSTGITDTSGNIRFPIYLPFVPIVNTGGVSVTGQLRVHDDTGYYNVTPTNETKPQGNIANIIVSGLSPLKIYSLDSSTGGTITFTF